LRDTGFSRSPGSSAQILFRIEQHRARRNKRNKKGRTVKFS